MISPLTDQICLSDILRLQRSIKEGGGSLPPLQMHIIGREFKQSTMDCSKSGVSNSNYLRAAEHPVLSQGGHFKYSTKKLNPLHPKKTLNCSNNCTSQHELFYSHLWLFLPNACCQTPESASSQTAWPHLLWERWQLKLSIWLEDGHHWVWT